jgi:hypothetical protein
MAEVELRATLPKFAGAGAEGRVGRTMIFINFTLKSGEFTEIIQVFVIKFS